MRTVSLAIILSTMLFSLASFAAWVTHIVASIMAGAWILLVIGALLPPVGVIHGVMIWSGAPWAG